MSITDHILLSDDRQQHDRRSKLLLLAGVAIVIILLFLLVVFAIGTHHSKSRQLLSEHLENSRSLLNQSNAQIAAIQRTLEAASLYLTRIGDEIGETGGTVSHEVRLSLAKTNAELRSINETLAQKSAHPITIVKHKPSINPCSEFRPCLAMSMTFQTCHARPDSDILRPLADELVDHYRSSMATNSTSAGAGSKPERSSESPKLTIVLSAGADERSAEPCVEMKRKYPHMEVYDTNSKLVAARMKALKRELTRYLGISNELESFRNHAHVLRIHPEDKCENRGPEAQPACHSEHRFARAYWYVSKGT